MNLRLFLLGLVVAASGTFAADTPRKPNVVLIVADDMGFSDPGCYGGEIQTPNLDKLAAGGLRFTQFYNTARCWPSRACILTGYYAQQVRRDGLPGVAGGAQGKRPAWAHLLPEYLKPLGYRTYHSGKWHVDGPVLAGGFDRSYCLEDHNRNFNPKKHTLDDQPLPPVEPGSGYYTSTAFADHAIKCLKDHAANHASEPFFTYFCFTVPHFPLQAPAEDIALYRDKYHVGWDTVRAARWERMTKLGIINCSLSALEREVGPPYYNPDAFVKLGPGEARFPVPWNELTEVQHQFQANKMSVHAAMVHRMDTEIGRVIDQLRAMNAFDNTLVLFLSDNGASAEIMIRGDGHDPAAAPGSAGSFLCLGPGWSGTANTPFRRHKVWVHEGGITTPLIAHWPAGIAARGEFRHNPSHLIDLAPTILELAGGKWPANTPPPPGKSLVPVFTQDSTVTHDCLWWLHENNRAIRVGDWKLVSAAKQGGEWELYDLKTDRSETKNLAATHPDKVQELSTLWQQRTDAFTALASKDLPPAPVGGPAKRKKAAKSVPNADCRRGSDRYTPTKFRQLHTQLPATGDGSFAFHDLAGFRIHHFHVPTAIPCRHHDPLPARRFHRPLRRDASCIAEPSHKNFRTAQRRTANSRRHRAFHRRQSGIIDILDELRRRHRNRLVMPAQVRLLELIIAILPPQHPPVHRAAHHRRPNRVANSNLRSLRDIECAARRTPIQPAFANQHRLAIRREPLADAREDQFIQIRTRAIAVRMHLHQIHCTALPQRGPLRTAGQRRRDRSPRRVCRADNSRRVLDKCHGLVLAGACEQIQFRENFPGHDALALPPVCHERFQPFQPQRPAGAPQLKQLDR